MLKNVHKTQTFKNIHMLMHFTTFTLNTDHSWNVRVLIVVRACFNVRVATVPTSIDVNRLPIQVTDTDTDALPIRLQVRYGLGGDITVNCQLSRRDIKQEEHDCISNYFNTKLIHLRSVTKKVAVCASDYNLELQQQVRMGNNFP